MTPALRRACLAGRFPTPNANRAAAMLSLNAEDESGRLLAEWRADVRSRLVLARLKTEGRAWARGVAAEGVAEILASAERDGGGR